MMSPKELRLRKARSRAQKNFDVLVNSFSKNKDAEGMEALAEALKPVFSFGPLNITCGTVDDDGAED